MTTTMSITGQCRICSWHGRVVLHGTTWCPRIPAVAIVDCNDYTRLGRVDRPVEVGDVIILLNPDGSDRRYGFGGPSTFMNWGRVLSFNPASMLITAKEIGETWATYDSWVYIPDDADDPVSEDINQDPEEVERLRRARSEVREGKTIPWQDSDDEDPS